MPSEFGLYQNPSAEDCTFWRKNDETTLLARPPSPSCHWNEQLCLAFVHEVLDCPLLSSVIRSSLVNRYCYSSICWHTTGLPKALKPSCQRWPTCR